MRIIFIALNQGNIIALFCQWIEAEFTLSALLLDSYYARSAELSQGKQMILSCLSLFDLWSFN